MFGFKDANVNAALGQAAEQYGLDPNMLRAIVQIESGGRADAQNPNSSAGGLFQFIDSTGSQYGLDASNKYDPVANADAGGRFIKDNIAGLSQTLGRAPNTGEVYLAHQQGLGGARKLLGNPDGRAVDTVGAAAVKLNGGHADMTNQEFANIWMNKANKIYADAAGVDFESAPTKAQAKGDAPAVDPFQTALNKVLGRSPADEDAPAAELNTSDRLGLLGQSLSSLGRGDGVYDIQSGVERLSKRKSV